MKNAVLLGLGALIVCIVVASVVIVRARTVDGQGAAFHVSEGGLQYVLHVLNTGACTPQELAQQPLVQSVPLEGKKEIPGIFAATFDEVKDAESTLTVRGHTGGLLGSCHTLTARVEAFSGMLGTKYRIASWEDQGVGRCGSMPRQSPLTCKGEVK